MTSSLLGKRHLTALIHSQQLLHVKVGEAVTLSDPVLERRILESIRKTYVYKNIAQALIFSRTGKIELSGRDKSATQLSKPIVSVFVFDDSDLSFVSSTKLPPKDKLQRKIKKDVTAKCLSLLKRSLAPYFCDDGRLVPIDGKRVSRVVHGAQVVVGEVEPGRNAGALSLKVAALRCLKITKTRDNYWTPFGTQFLSNIRLMSCTYGMLKSNSNNVLHFVYRIMRNGLFE